MQEEGQLPTAPKKNSINLKLLENFLKFTFLKIEDYCINKVNFIRKAAQIIYIINFTSQK